MSCMTFVFVEFGSGNKKICTVLIFNQLYDYIIILFIFQTVCTGNSSRSKQFFVCNFIIFHFCCHTHKLFFTSKSEILYEHFLIKFFYVYNFFYLIIWEPLIVVASHTQSTYSLSNAILTLIWHAFCLCDFI